MIENTPTNVVAAFEMLLEELEAEIEFVNKIGAKAFEGRDYERARAALERAGQFTAFRDKVASLRKEWETLATTSYQPILKALADLGGSARMSEVLVRVEQLMRGVLKNVDYEPLSSDPETPRWRNTAQWARNSMVKEGLLKQNSPRGIWEISEARRQFLTRRER